MYVFSIHIEWRRCPEGRERDSHRKGRRPAHEGNIMYLQHFGLNQPPFSTSPDPQFLWLGGSYASAFETLKRRHPRGQRLPGADRRRRDGQDQPDPGAGSAGRCRRRLPHDRRPGALGARFLQRPGGRDRDGAPIRQLRGFRCGARALSPAGVCGVPERARHRRRSPAPETGGARDSRGAVCLAEFRPHAVQGRLRRRSSSSTSFCSRRRIPGPVRTSPRTTTSNPSPGRKP